VSSAWKSTSGSVGLGGSRLGRVRLIAALAGLGVLLGAVQPAAAAGRLGAPTSAPTAVDFAAGGAFSVALAVDKPVFGVDEQVTLTATVNQDIMSRPGVSGDSEPWKDRSYGTTEQVPRGAA